ncbi:MAG: peptidyl-prolyl cis-trans isomerase [Pseudomonadota bacterium]
MNLPGWAREPLVHFIVLGAALYVALTWGGSPPDPASRVIKVGASEKEKIAESWTLTMGRSPTDAELDQAIDAYVREEVLYREALRLGLDESDAIVRRRLVSKMDFSASLAAETAEPSEEVLRAFLKENPELYADYGTENSRVSFDQSFFSSEAEARVALSSGANAGEATSLPASIETTAMRDVEARFGQDFVSGLNVLEPGDDWQGPLPSGFGWHLVRLRERATEPPDFESMRGALANDWRNAQIKTRKERAYEVLRSAYRIDIDR